MGRADSTPQAQPIIDMVMNEARQYNRIYVASVHPDISEQDLRSVFMAFGEITKCQLARHSSGKKHRLFLFIIDFYKFIFEEALVTSILQRPNLCARRLMG